MLTTPLNRMTRLALAVATLLAAAALPACGDLQNNTIPVEMVTYRPDGSLVMFTRAGIEIYDGKLETRINHISLEALAPPPYATDDSFSYGLSADGTVAAVSFDHGVVPGVKSRVAIYSIPDGKLLNLFELDDAATMAGYTQGVEELATSPDGTRVYVAWASNGTATATVLDTATGAPIWTQAGAWTLPVWSADGATLFAMNTDWAALTSSLDALDAATGALKWRTHLTDANSDVGNLTGLALVGNGTLLTGPQFDPSGATACPAPNAPPGECPPVTSFWSPADGSVAAELPPVPLTVTDGVANPTDGTAFVCNATDTCAQRLVEYNPPTPNDIGEFISAPTAVYVRLYKTDGSELQRLPVKAGGASGSGSMAISPDGQFIAVADDYQNPGGVKLFSVADGTMVGSRSFPTDTF